MRGDDQETQLLLARIAELEQQLQQLQLRLRELESGTTLHEGQQLKETLQLWQGPFEAALRGGPITVWHQDADLRYTWVANPVGFTIEQVLGKTDRELYPDPMDAQALETIKRSALGSGSPVREEVRLRLTGGERYFDLWVQPLRQENQIVGLAGVSWEITGRKRAEQGQRQFEIQLQQAQKLQTIQSMAAGIAHDFNNLLTCILGYTTLVEMGLPEASPLRNYIQQIYSSCQRATNLCKHMLAYAGRVRFQFTTVDLSQLLRQMTSLLRGAISPRATLYLDLAEPVPLIQGDPEQLQQLIFNLVTNASEALQDQPGQISVRTKVVQADRALLKSPYIPGELAEGTYVLLEVQDTGCGITPEMLGQIFDPFVSSKFVGRGLGLAVGLGIVHSHQGTIKVQSTPGQGSTFQVFFPSVDQTTASRLQSPSAGGRDTILVIEDQEEIRTLVRLVLNHAGFQVLEAADGQEGIQRFTERQHGIAMVVLDLTLPVLAGQEVFQRLRQQAPTVPILLLGSYSPLATRPPTTEQEPLAFVEKPFTPDELLQVVRQLVKQE